MESTGEPTELAQTIFEHERVNHRGIEPQSTEFHADLSMDLAQVTATLPDDWQDLLLLCSTYTKAEVIERTGIKRSTLNDRLRKIRARLTETGIEDYF